VSTQKAWKIVSFIIQPAYEVLVSVVETELQSGASTVVLR
jgi:hypothetical protein